MISVEEAVIARVDSHGEHFEVLVDPEKGLEVKKGEEVPLDELIAANEVYVDAEKGKRASEEDLNKAFGTNDLKEIVYKIIREGEVQLTTEQRRKMRKEKRKKVASIIARRAMNPQTNKPHPPKRIRNAMDEAGVHIDATENAESQVSGVIDKLRPIIPISVEEIKLAVKVPPEYAGKASGQLRDVGELMEEEWRNDGSWIGKIKMPAGLQDKFYKKVNSLTKGEAETKIIDR